MIDEDKVCLDLESEWEKTYASRHYLVYRHKKRRSLCRIVDIKAEEIIFADSDRITPDRVIDINKKLTAERKLHLCETLLASLFTSFKPVTMPYTPETIKVYIEDLGSVIGVLYYMDVNDPARNVVPVKLFFREDKIDDKTLYANISFDEYQERKEKLDVDLCAEEDADKSGGAADDKREPKQKKHNSKG